MATSSMDRPTSSRVGAYLLAAFALLPALIFWLFARVALWPRLEWFWTNTGFARYTGLSGGAPIACAPDTLITAVRMLMLRAPLVFLLVLLVFVSADFFIPGLSRFRKPALSVFVFLCTSTVFLLFTMMCISAIMAHPVAQ